MNLTFAVGAGTQNQVASRNYLTEEPPYGTFVLPLVGSIPVCETLLSNGANEVVIRSNDNEIPFEEWVPFVLGPEPEPGQPQLAHFAVYIDLYRLDPRVNTEFDVDIFVEGDTACESLQTTPACHCKQFHISYVAAEEAWYSYDNRENLVQKVVGEDVWAYTYDALNRMTSFTTPDSTTREFRYDPAGRMIASRTDGGDWDTHMVSPGWEVLADMDKHLAPRRMYVTAGGLDNQIAMIYDSGGGNWKTLFYLRDHLGSVLALVTPDGEIVESYEYEPYGLPTVYDHEGEVIPNRTSAVGNRFMFTGREWDDVGQFYHYRHRTYSPHEKRFMQRDPIGLAGGWNVYAYCGGDPVNASDPLGLWPSQKGFYVHQESIDRALGFLSIDEREILKKGVRDADDAVYQTSAYSYRHAMRGCGESVTTAEGRANSFVKDEIGKARRFRVLADQQFSFSKQRKNRGLEHGSTDELATYYRRLALQHLSLAMHAMQDHTSPAHSHFRAWCNPGVIGTAAHIHAELYDPGEDSALDRATYLAYRYYWTDIDLADLDMFPVGGY